MAQAQIQVCLPSFDGTLDLLLRAVLQERLDILAVSLTHVTQQYLLQVRAQAIIDPVALADLVAIGARLLFIKSRTLLPSPARREAEIEDPIDDLQNLLNEYRHFHTAAGLLRTREEESCRAFPRLVAYPLPIADKDTAVAPILPARLLDLFLEALNRDVETSVTALAGELITIRDTIDQVMAALQADGPLGFLALIRGCSSRLEIVVRFIAILHLIKEGLVIAVQPMPFGDILLERNCSSQGA